ncbi:hypothetical protein NEPTK9_000577 [Candidatus Neptunochlamydia vexilliferae]|uniref:Uncharacterized protein n=1 Tax=Candidatus Neptunichlamydia vexilliferae TaxID=1651774 RepID=A0ABS0AY55_9BACT|nr:hypothetical protein [Candidatus Neptunochlamydia vexilliferae]
MVRRKSKVAAQLKQEEKNPFSNIVYTEFLNIFDTLSLDKFSIRISSFDGNYQQNKNRLQCHTKNVKIMLYR